MAISTGPTHAHNSVEAKKLGIGLIATVSGFIAFLWVLLAPIFSYEPISSEIDTPPGTELASFGSSATNVLRLQPPHIG